MTELDREALRDLVHEIAADPAAWSDHIRHDPEQRTYELLRDDEDVTVWLICWSEGHDTGFHDHDTSQGAVHVVSGELVEERLRLGAPPEAPPRPGRRDLHLLGLGHPPRAPRGRPAGGDHPRVLSPAPHVRRIPHRGGRHPAALRAERARGADRVASFDDVRELALAFPETEETTGWGNMMWKVKGKLFVWERPLRKSDLAALGETAPEGPILGARVEHLVAKEALTQDPSGLYFTTPHFDGVPSILVQLEPLGRDDLEELVTEAWLVRAPDKLSAAWLAKQGGT